MHGHPGGVRHKGAWGPGVIDSRAVLHHSQAHICHNKGTEALTLPGLGQPGLPWTVLGNSGLCLLTGVGTVLLHHPFALAGKGALCPSGQTCRARCYPQPPGMGPGLPLYRSWLARSPAPFSILSEA